MSGCIPAVELDDDLAGTVVINFLEFTNVAWKEEGLVKCCDDELNVANHGATKTSFAR